MNAEIWQANNNQYLAVSLHWLRLRLEQLAQTYEPVAPIDQPPVTAGPHPAQPLVRRLFGSQQVVEATPTKPLLLLEDHSASLEAQVAQAAQERTTAAQMQPLPALLILREQLGLTSFEQETLLLCAALELDTRLPALCARAQGDPQRPYPTFALALALFDEASWDALTPQRPLRYWRLIEINQPGATPLTLSALRTDERIINYVKGLNTLDDRLLPFFQPLAMPQGATFLAPSQQTAVATIVRQWQRAADGVAWPLAQLLGVDALSKQLVAQEAVAALDRQLYRLSSATLPAQMAEQESLARLWQRESLLLPVALYVDAHEPEGVDKADVQASLERFLARDLGIVLLSTRDAPHRLPGPTFAIDVEKPTANEQRAAWFAALNEVAQASGLTLDLADADATAQRMAGQFSLNLREIYTLAASCGETTDASLSAATLHDQIWDACRAVTRPRLDTLAQRLDAKATWDDMVLPAEQTRLLRQIAEQVRQRSKVYDEWGFADKMNRGFGISALFAGDSGTGKTMAAEVIANDLRLNLYRIDLSAVVSKYIGETEKNLRRLFDAAEMGGAILFFDEADALFGKRSEVKDSHDRYANIEINYLLQRMEAFSGLAILATNMKSALDPAFMRRLRFIVNFPFPGVPERKRMWQKVFPAQMPQGDLDHDRLARLNLTGGNIHSIALNAAFLAAQTATPVTMAVVLTAARTEFRKLEKSINEADFRV